jgi:hypothetical protein
LSGVSPDARSRTRSNFHHLAGCARRGETPRNPAAGTAALRALGEFVATLGLPLPSMEALNELRAAPIDGQLTNDFVEAITRKFGLGRM